MIHANRPETALRHLVRYYYGVEESYGSRRVLQPVPARSPPIVEFMFGTPYQVQRLYFGSTEDAWPVTLVGPKTHRCVNLFLTGHVDSFAIAFQPTGFLAIVGVPPEELTNQDCDAGSLLGRFIAEVHERELNKQIQIVSTLIPPLIMLVIASVVGLVVYGILSAVFGLTQGLRGGMH